MSLSLFLLPNLLLALGAHSYALPNPQAASITPAPATGATLAKLPASTPGTDYYYDSAELASESREYASLTAKFYRTAKASDIAALNSDRAEWAALTSDLYETVDLALESKRYASATAEFYATAKTSDIARLVSDRKAASAELAAWTSELYRTPNPEEAASLSADWRQYTSEAAVWETYTGTDSPFTRSNASATATLPAQITTSGAASTTGAGASQGAFPPLQRSQSTPAADAFTCLDSSASEMSDHTLQFSDCDATIQAICDNLTGDVANRVAGQWTWSAKGGKCAMGYWLPAIGDAVPSATACQANIFDRMRRTCIPVNSQGGRWNAASVNIAVVPDAANSGQQVDATKPSFLMAGSPYPCGSAGCKMLDS